MSNLSEIKHLDPDNRWHRLQLTRDSDLVAVRTLLAFGIAVVVAGAALVLAVKARQR